MGDLNARSKSLVCAPKKKFLFEYQADEKNQQKIREKIVKEAAADHDAQNGDEGRPLIIDDNDYTDSITRNNAVEISQKGSNKIKQSTELTFKTKNFKDLNLSSCISQLIASELNCNDNNPKDQSISSLLPGNTDQRQEFSLNSGNDKDPSFYSHAIIYENNDGDALSKKNEFVHKGVSYGGFEPNNREEHPKQKGLKRNSSETSFKGFTETKGPPFVFNPNKFSKEIAHSSKMYSNYKIDKEKATYMKDGSNNGRSDSKHNQSYFNSADTMYDQHTLARDPKNHHASQSPLKFICDSYNASQIDRNHLSQLPHFPTFPPYYLPFQTHHPPLFQNAPNANSIDFKHSSYNFHSKNPFANTSSERSKISTSSNCPPVYQTNSPDLQFGKNSYSNVNKTSAKAAFKPSDPSGKFPHHSKSSSRADSESPMDLSIKKSHQSAYEHSQQAAIVPQPQQPNFSFNPSQSFLDHHQFMLAAPRPLSGYKKNGRLHGEFLRDRLNDESAFRRLSSRDPVESSLQEESTFDGSNYKNPPRHTKPLEPDGTVSSNHLDYYPRMEDYRRGIQAPIYSPHNSSPPKLLPINATTPQTEQQNHYHCKVCDSMFVGYRKFRSHFLRNHKVEPHPEHFVVTIKSDKTRPTSLSNVFPKNESQVKDFKVPNEGVKSGVVNEGVKRVAEVLPMVTTQGSCQRQSAKASMRLCDKYNDKMRLASQRQETRYNEKKEESNCHKCMEGFLDVSEWKEHISLVHSNQGNNCKICNTSFNSGEELGRHLQSKHSMERRGVNVVFKCLYCRMVFTDEEVLLVHTNEHEKALSLNSRLSTLSEMHSHPASGHSASQPAIQTELPDTTTCLESDLKQPCKQQSPPATVTKAEAMADKNDAGECGRRGDNAGKNEEGRPITADCKHPSKKKFFLTKFQQEEQSALASLPGLSRDAVDNSSGLFKHLLSLWFS